MSTVWRKFESPEERLAAVDIKLRKREIREKQLIDSLNTFEDDDYSDIHDIWEDPSEDAVDPQ